ncbi:MAG: DUF1549 domain-containing protein, partial [Planctomycetales bacterium]|nr:DUF1549 domain-containing protein [Planctomycetales bacterium]
MDTVCYNEACALAIAMGTIATTTLCFAEQPKSAHQTDDVFLRCVLLLNCVISCRLEAADFNRDVRPILSNYCFQCHGPDAENREADLRLDEENSATQDRGEYRVIDRSSPAASELLVRIDSNDPDLVMPPPDVDKDLSDEQRATLREWILGGGQWKQHWAYVQPIRFDTPDMPRDNDWVQTWAINWIDRFIADRLVREDLQPSESADPITLIRRASFDITGLPPSIDMLSRFEAGLDEA